MSALAVHQDSADATSKPHLILQYRKHFEIDELYQFHSGDPFTMLRSLLYGFVTFNECTVLCSTYLFGSD